MSGNLSEPQGECYICHQPELGEGSPWCSRPHGDIWLAHAAAPASVVVRGWLNDIDRALRDVFTSEAEEDYAMDSATYALDQLRAYLEASVLDR